MHSDFYEAIGFKLGMLIDTIELYILIHVFVTLNIIQGSRSASNNNKRNKRKGEGGNYPTKFSIDLGGNWYIADTC